MNFKDLLLKKRTFYWMYLIVGVSSIIASIVINSNLITNHLSSDGSISNMTIYKIWIFRISSLLLGILLSIYGILKIIKNSFILKVDIYINKIINYLKKPRIILIIIFFFLGLVSIIRIIDLTMGGKWEKASGHEYYWIAQSISQGKGFSFPANRRWLFNDFETKYPKDQFFATAWEEPVYPYYVGFFLRYFKNYGSLAVLISQIIIFYFTVIVVYLISKKIFTSYLSIIPSIILFFYWPEARILSETTFSPVIFTGFFLSLSVYLFLSFLEDYSVKRGVILGISLGITCLTMSASILFVPIMIVLILLYLKGTKLAFYRAIVILTTFIIVLLPWMIRNYNEFGELILVRNGAGQGLHISNPITVSTYNNGKFAHEDVLGPIWKADNAEDALKQISNNSKKRIMILKRSYDVIALEAPNNFYEFNEAQRDKFYLKRSVDFIFSNPSTFINLTYKRLKMFLSGWNRKHLIVSLLSILSILIWWKNPKVIFVAALSGGYIFTFSIIGAWFYRYRYPIEPLFFVLLSGLIIFVINKIKYKITWKK